MERPGESREFGQTLFFPPELNEISPAPDQIFRDRLRPSGRDISEIENGVKSGPLERLRRTQSVRRPFEGRSSNASEFIIRSTKPVS